MLVPDGALVSAPFWFRRRQAERETKSEIMKTTIRNLLAAIILLAASLQTHAQGVAYDQQSATAPTSPTADDFLNIQEDSPLLQSFMPTFSAIGFVQFEFWDIANNGNNGATVYVNLWTGSPNINSATLLGSTAPVYMPNGFVNSGLGFAGIANFSFSTPVTLTAGQTYYLQPVVLSGDNPWDIGVLTYDAYSNGQLFSNGLPGSTIDLWFREGVVSVPEPSILVLFGLSGLLAFSFKRRSRVIVVLLFSVTVLSVHAAPDSVVQATADEAGLTPVSAAALPRIGTFWVMIAGPNGRLMALPYPMLPPDLSDLPTYSVVDNIFIVDDTGGQLLPSSVGRMSSAQASSIMQTQATTMANLIGRILYPTADEEFQPMKGSVPSIGQFFRAMVQ